MKRCLPIVAAGFSFVLWPDAAVKPDLFGFLRLFLFFDLEQLRRQSLTAPVDYLGAVAKGQQSAIKTIDTAQLKQAIQNFQIAEERLPASLDELVAKGHLRQIPATPHGMKIQYDPKTGAVAVVKM